MSKMSDQTNRAVQGTKNNAEGLGYGIAIIVPWLIRDYAGIEVPAEVLSAFSAMAMAVAVRIKERFER